MRFDRVKIGLQLRKEGGAWLAAVRTFMQERIVGGDSVTWDADTPELRGITPRVMEEIALRVAYETVADERAKTAALLTDCLMVVSETAPAGLLQRRLEAHLQHLRVDLGGGG